MSIRVVKASTGERMVFLTDEPFGMPDTWVTGYMVTELRGSGLAWRSIRNALEGISRGLAFFQKRGVDDLRACVLHKLPNDDELVTFADHCRRRVAGGDDPIIKAGAHYSAFVDYLVWLHAQPCAKGRPEETMVSLREDFRRRAARKRPKDDDPNPGGIRLGLTEEQRDLFLRVIIPTAPDTPFGSMAFRNFVLLLMSFMLGLRAGELLGLKVHHLNLRGPTYSVRIERNPDDPEDDRRLPPAQKTLERELPIAEDLALACRQLLKERRMSDAAKRHPFVFVSNEGRALSSSAWARCFERYARDTPSSRV